MKLRLLPVLLTFCITGVLLFGGWFTYQSLAVKDPIQEVMAGIAGIEQFSIVTDQDSVTVSVTLEGQANLYEVWHSIHDQVQDVARSRNIQIDIMNESSAALDHIWSTTLFDIAEAMDTQQYSNIPAVMNELSTQIEGLHVSSAMDDHNVYLTLTLDDSYKYVILPRISQIGAWSNE